MAENKKVEVIEKQTLIEKVKGNEKLQKVGSTAKKIVKVLPYIAAGIAVGIVGDRIAGAASSDNFVDADVEITPVDDANDDI